MACDTPDMHPARRRLADLAEMSTKRAERAAWKLERARLEASAAAEALQSAQRHLLAWDAANPDPQFSLIEAINSKGGQS